MRVSAPAIADSGHPAFGLSVFPWSFLYVRRASPALSPLIKNAEIIIDGDSAKNNDKDSRMLMNLGLNMVASENLRIGLTLEKSTFGDYDTDLAVNLNARYSF